MAVTAFYDLTLTGHSLREGPDGAPLDDATQTETAAAAPVH